MNSKILRSINHENTYRMHEKKNVKLNKKCDEYLQDVRQEFSHLGFAGMKLHMKKIKTE